MLKSHSGVQCYRLHIWDHSFTKWTESSLESRSSQHGNLCNEAQPWGPPLKGRGARGGAGAVELGLTLFPRRQASGTATGRCVTKVQVKKAVFQAIDVRRMNNGVFNAMTDEE
ncbi:G patch domain-containing protein [Trichinella spiralis]|uniref:G patch domain-containing protein n=2 Tax=Trichinella spiralis TaxID=6334 RepID=A0ABR3KUX3_TRISP